MKTKITSIVSFLMATMILWGCGPKGGDENLTTLPMSKIDQKVAEFKTVRLDADISHLSEDQKEMLTHLIDAAKIMDEIFWYQAFGDKDTLLNRIQTDELETFVRINYGPWERLNENQPFIEGYGPKPAGANYYPRDMTREEFENFESDDKTSLYTLIRRDDQGNLTTIPYNEAWPNKTQRAAGLLREAARMAENESFKKYLNLRAEALIDDEYLASDMAWMDVKDNDVDFVVGPIETYEDNLFGYKAAH